MNKIRYKEGDRVILPENKAEGWKHEHGTVLEDQTEESTRSYPTVIAVEVDDQFRDHSFGHDDGIREVAYEDMSPELSDREVLRQKTPREDKMDRRISSLSCAFCPPHRGENATRTAKHGRGKKRGQKGREKK